MDGRESLTKELREWVSKYIEAVLDKRDLLIMADRIDKAHEEEVRHAYDIGFASADDWYADKTDDDLAEHGLVRLPVDADGEPWRFGDRCNNGERLGVIHLYDNGNGRLDFRGGTKIEVIKGSTTSRHHHPTPAERIRAWVDSARDDRADFRDLLAIADGLEADDE